MLVGLDFDNTLVRYDHLFHKIALEERLIHSQVPVSKTAIRDHLRSQSNEDAWTRIQGQVYGSRISEAEPFEGMKQALLSLQAEGCSLCIVSHKTKYPYLGDRVDLHAAAEAWLEENEFFSDHGLGLSTADVHFLPTKDEKAEMIVSLGCDCYVDDLPEILQLLPTSLRKFLYDPKLTHQDSANWVRFSSWDKFRGLVI